MTTTVTCKTCNKSGDPLDTPSWHPFRHPINTGHLTGQAILGTKQKPVSSPAASQAVLPQQSAYPFDPVLRQALIMKGVLTPDDLRDAENIIQAVTSSMGGSANAPYDGTPAKSSGRSTNSSTGT